jgi:flagellar protein FliS
MTYRNAAAARTAYVRDAVTTASPGKLLCMLYDRLVRDLVTAEAAISASDLTRASTELMHAQQIVLELRTSLDLSAWDGAAGLADLYTFLHAELVTANLRKDAGRVRGCLEIVEPLAEAWRAAALQSTQATRSA